MMTTIGAMGGSPLACEMNHREFLRRSALAALMATPAMRAMALMRDFGVPGVATFDAADVTWTANSGQVVAQWLAVYTTDESKGVGIVDLSKDELHIEWTGLPNCEKALEL